MLHGAMLQVESEIQFEDVALAEEVVTALQEDAGNSSTALAKLNNIIAEAVGSEVQMDAPKLTGAPILDGKPVDCIPAP